MFCKKIIYTIFNCVIKMNIYILLFAFTLSGAYGYERKINSTLNPGCRQQCNKTDVTLIYTRATGSNDTIHQIWDFTGGIPTIIFAIGRVNSTIDFDWDGKKPDFFILEKPKYSFAAAIDKVYEYNDLEDHGQINKNYSQKSFPLSQVAWRRMAMLLSEKEAMVHLRSDHWRHGVIEFKVDLLPFKDYAKDLPHLIHSSNSSLVDVSLVNMSLSAEYNSSRFALHTVFASTDSRADTMNCKPRKSLDDEHTPGVFEVIEITTPESNKNGDGGFVQFRPVAYTQRERSVSSSTNVRVSKLNSTRLPSSSTMQKFYSQLNTSPLVQDMFVSFGDPGDGFYVQHNYTAWSFTIGYGSPPVEGFSLFVILVISIGLGVPVVLAMSGILYVFIRKFRQTRQQRQRLLDDE